MNYLPFVGFGFYGALTSVERASFYCSWGLLEDAPAPSIIMGIRSAIRFLLYKKPKGGRI